MTVAARLELGDVSVTIADDDHGPYVLTTFPDGAHTIARPEAGEPWEQVRAHDVTHALGAFLAGLPHSPALWNLAHGDGRYPDDEVAEDEARTLAAQAAMVGPHPDLVEVAPGHYRRR